MRIPAKIPKIVQVLGKGMTFRIETDKPEVFLTFDDGPIDNLTPWILTQLEEYQAKATFFMVGENIEKRPSLVEQILRKGHSIGNHTFNHLNGFKTNRKDYLENVERCAESLHRFLNEGNPRLFRPPYGCIMPGQAKELRRLGYQIIMWDVLSQDYNRALKPELVVENVLQHVKPGSIVVMHDNVKAEQNLRYALPKILEGVNSKGLTFATL